MRDLNKLTKSIVAILTILILWSNPVIAQVGIIEEEVELAIIVGNKDFGLLVKKRFKDSIPGLDTMMFRMKISRKGKVRDLQYLKNYYAPSISKNDLIRISDFAKDSISWEPAIVKVKNRWKKVSSWVFVYVNPELIDRLE
ncbi:hypothetical protein L0U88_06035 [Flavihumibacter sp. RY-1]|uniref:Uncharacterized protein n=1 Tax=Flavihumibacter fluminis TaxID=2909236 RepID=A0ABS9BF74_9BACT|nr:hypothetical protein [Flavihumibacter fluminis]MCF1714181.1 hypothetical protein [Flavihumibacter fluminis]